MISAPGSADVVASNVSHDQQFVVIDVWKLANRRKGLLLLGLILGIALSVVYALTTEAIYESEAQILVIQKGGNLAVGGTEAKLGFEASVGEELLATHMQIISSPKIIRDALTEQRSEIMPNDTIVKSRLIDLPSLRSRVSEEERAERATYERAVVEYVRENLHVGRGGEGTARSAKVLLVKFQHVSDVDTAEILRSIVTSYRNFIENTVQGVGDEAAKLISDAKDSLTAQLEQQDEKYKQFLLEVPMLWKSEESLNPHQIRASHFEAELAKVRYRRAEVRSRLGVVEATLKRDSEADEYALDRLALVDNADIARLTLLLQVERGDALSEEFQAAQPARAETANAEFDRLLALKLDARRQELELGANHPDVVRTRQQIDHLEKMLSEKKANLGGVEDDQRISPALLAKAYAHLLGHDLVDLDRREQELQSLLAQEQKDAKGLVALELQEQKLRQERERTQALYSAVVDRLREISLLRDYGGYVTDTISPVELGAKSWPRIPLLLLVGCLAGMLTGCVFAVVAEVTDRSFRSSDEISREMGAPILTHIPQLNLSQRTGPIDGSLVVYHQPRSRDAEAFRRLRTAIYFRNRGETNRVIQVTSPNASDGKTTLISNLAVSVAQAGKRVLLIDCDLRRPRVHKIFGLGKHDGLSSLLIGEYRFDDVVARNVIGKLDVLASGDVPPNPAELLALPAFTQLLADARDEYDFVFLDSPPMLAVSDPVSIAEHVDGLILNLKLTKHCRRSAARSREMFSSNGVDLLGVVVNGDPLGVDHDYYYYGYDNGKNSTTSNGVYYQEASS